MLAVLIKELPEGTHWDREEGAMGIPTTRTHKLSTKKASGDFSVTREIGSVSVCRRLHVDSRQPGIESQLCPASLHYLRHLLQLSGLHFPSR